MASCARFMRDAATISIARVTHFNALAALERGENPETSPAIQFAVNTEITALAPAGPEAARGLEHVMGVYSIWDTGNTRVIDAAQQFLLDLVQSFDPDVAEAEGWGTRYRVKSTRRA